MILIAICCDAGPDAGGNERKLTIVINADGEVQEVRRGWPGVKEEVLGDGPTLEITPEEYQRQLEIVRGKEQP